MSGGSWSCAVQLWKASQGGPTHIRVKRVAEEEVVDVSNGSYVVRVTIDTERVLTRCLIRHVASGREVHVQGGLGLRVFVEECLLYAPPDQPRTSPEGEG